MTHDHRHGHTSATASHGRRMLIVFAITLTIVTAQVVGGLLANSLALLADAGHMFTDAAGVGMSLFAIWIAGRPPSASRTFGYQRTEIFAAAGNAVLLFGVGILILVEAVRRLSEPPDVDTGLMIAVATTGLVGSLMSLLLLRRGQAESLNVRGAFLEVLSDLLGSAAVMIGAVVIAVTGFRETDAIVSVVIGVMIIPRTWRLLRDAVDILLESTPRDVDLDEVRRHIIETDGVLDVHDLHAWTITSGMPVLSAHVVVHERASHGRVLDGLGRCLAGHFDIEHSTFQLEPPGHQDHEGVLHA